MTARRPTPRQPCRVLLVGPSLDILGGQSVQARALREGLSTLPDLRVSFLAVNPRLPGPLRHLQRVKYFRTVVTSLAYCGALAARVPRADVITAFSAGYWSFLLAPVPALLLARATGRKAVLYYHTGEAEDHLRRHGWFVKPLMRLADAIVVPSSFLVDVFSRHGLSATAITNFVDIGQLPYRTRALPTPRFLANRNLEPMYNVACILRAFALIQAAVPEASLVVAGRGSQESGLKALAARQGLRNVSFAGAVAPESMGALYDASDIYLNSPDIDNMPLSLIEAFVCGTPVVSTNAGGIPVMVRNEVNGLLVDRNDEAALAAAALRLLREPGLADRLASRARADALERYTWDAAAPRWRQLYQGLMADGSGATEWKGG